MFATVDCQLYHKIGIPYLWLYCFISKLLQQVQAGPCPSFYNTTGFLELTMQMKNTFVIRRILPVFTTKILLPHHE